MPVDASVTSSDGTAGLVMSAFGHTIVYSTDVGRSKRKEREVMKPVLERDGAVSTADLGVGVLRVPKASQVLAEILRERILDGELLDGAALSSERELAQETRLSRTAIREAIRVLETEGLVSVRPGRGGGMFVRDRQSEVMTRTFDHYIRSHRVRFDSLIEIRETIEPDCAAFAAERCTEAEIDELYELNARVRVASELDDPADFLTENVNWHIGIAVASHNELLAAFMRAISCAMRAATDIDDFNSPTIKKAAVRAHDAVLAAIRDRDPEAARARMHNHVLAYRQEVLRKRVPDEVPLDEGSAG
jgi:GntR family transcriptional regulator, transcriptional repressor for pyruvate dehydrogenase complex